tara:strand:+ start:253 stop:492 length:240 start_codon:yes stop_codon:yes gene_type:complete
MKECLSACKRLDVNCPVVECRNWINFPKEKNCLLESVNINGPLTLRQTADRLKISFVRVKQIEDKALKKISHFFEKESI